MLPVRELLPLALRVLAISDGVGDPDRVAAIVERAIDGGVHAFQLREPKLSAAQLVRLCERIRPMIDDVDGVLLVNDRVDVAAAGFAHGVHVGRNSLPIELVREQLPEPALIGCSTHNAAELERAAAAFASYATLSPVYPTTCKPGAEVLGPTLASELTVRARVPVLWLGGIEPERVTEVRESAAYGVAVRSALFEADDVTETARRLVARVRG